MGSHLSAGALGRSFRRLGPGLIGCTCAVVGRFARPSECAPGCCTSWVGAGAIVHERKRVGAYDVATVSARTSDALLNWPRENGFQTDPRIGPALDAYARGGWCFVAYKFVRESRSQGRDMAHPPSFSFGAAQAVYPLRLTVVGNNDLSLDLYFSGPKEARLPGFARKRVGMVVKGLDQS